jgi:AGZA family xanthine/uracil permease-like MFS transporter
MAAMTFFGVIHSASIDGVMYLPWTLAPALRQIPYQFALGYVVLAAGLLLLGMTKEAREPLAVQGNHHVEPAREQIT